MDDVRAAPTAGIVACLLVLAVLALPYLLVERGAGVGAYYAAGVVPPFVAGLFALVCVIVFAAGREERSDPALVAGASLAFGLFTVFISALWAVTVPESVVLQLGEVSDLAATLLVAHRYLLVVASAGVPASAAWYAWILELM